MLDKIRALADRDRVLRLLYDHRLTEALHPVRHAVINACNLYQHFQINRLTRAKTIYDQLKREAGKISDLSPDDFTPMEWSLLFGAQHYVNHLLEDVKKELAEYIELPVMHPPCLY